jgi:NAD(P)-dependent dehydrogenase (short-subunit alcohol dehydrogenase family)
MKRVVVITGGGGGLGRALARGAAAAGDLAVAIGRNRDALIETGQGLDPAHYTYRMADVSDFAALEAAIADVAAGYGRIDGLFANAAVYPRTLVADQTVAEFMDALTVNVGGVFAACRAVLPSMMRTGHGRIMVVGSLADRRPIHASAAYSASKGALHALTKAIAVEVGPDYPDILVNEWVPGSLKTGMGIADGIEPEVSARWGLAMLDLPPGGPTGELFRRDKLDTPPLSLKQRIKRKIGLG